MQLLLPDHGEERALLTAVEAAIPADAWLVTYNGRGFDWPLLTTRFRLARRPAPSHAGHLDLLPVVRRVFRHRMVDARLRTAEAVLLGLHRVGDVEGWEIPGRYHEFLRGGSAAPLAEVARHNDQDVRSLAWLLAHLADRYGDPAERSEAPPGDLAGLARSFAREHRLDEALGCLDAAADRPIERTVMPTPSSARGRRRHPGRRSLVVAATAGRFRGPPDAALDRPRSSRAGPPLPRRGRPNGSPSTGRTCSAASVVTPRPRRRGPRWPPAPGRIAIVAAIELAKIREHRLRDRRAALDAVVRGLDVVERRRRLGRPEPALEADLLRRASRLRRRIGPVSRDGR